jgi:hypothetical protein
MTETYSTTFNREDIKRVHAAFAADYRIAAESTKLHSSKYVDKTVAGIKAFAEEQYLQAIHMRLVGSDGSVREAAVYEVTTDASGWTSERPGDMYWKAKPGDKLQLTIFHNANWAALTQAKKNAFNNGHLPGWGPSSFDGRYDGMTSSADRQYASRAYGLQRTRHSRPR